MEHQLVPSTSVDSNMDFDNDEDTFYVDLRRRILLLTEDDGDDQDWIENKLMDYVSSNIWKQRFESSSVATLQSINSLDCWGCGYVSGISFGQVNASKHSNSNSNSNSNGTGVFIPRVKRPIRTYNKLGGRMNNNGWIKKEEESEDHNSYSFKIEQGRGESKLYPTAVEKAWVWNLKDQKREFSNRPHARSPNSPP